MTTLNLLSLVTKLSDEFHRIALLMAENQQDPDGIMQSITITLDKLRLAIGNDQKISPDIKNGLDKACIVAVRMFESSEIENNLFKIKELLRDYRPR